MLRLFSKVTRLRFNNTFFNTQFMGKRLITTLLVLLTIGVQAFAQSAVSGKVTDEAGSLVSALMSS